METLLALPIARHIAARDDFRKHSSAFSRQSLEPFACLAAHVFRRGTPVADPALHPVVAGQHGESLLVEARLDRAQLLECQAVEPDAISGRLGDDPAGNMMGLAER